ncbi:hypothetical protein BN971_03538 [Mycobacterium bohemicum DSM 44277]|uniref:Uncharacterized protein n=1 Tax=Mycobacterium bohemicum DSM 44277 TaxID=1236609 RepID=A0A0U0WCB1_MYCBE|nr:hypothetical protein BN971_03538 [Mycobacterium bohemicum DSM 44277]
MSGSNAARKHKWANRNAARPRPNDSVHHGIASNQSPAADNRNAGISHRRSRTNGCAAAATANSTAIDAFNGGCRIQCPVSSTPGGERSASTVR